MPEPYRAIAPLAEAEVVHVIGDVHGHIDPLRTLMGQLGLVDGPWPRGHLLVFVGDLTDRGPDSPAVVRYVGELVAAGRAQMVLGNHEMKLLGERGPSDSASNHWFWGEQTPGYPPQQVCTAAERDELRAILEPMPIALTSEELRVVHAAWLDEPLATCDALGARCGSDLWRRSRRLIRASKPDFWDEMQPRLHDLGAGAPSLSAADFAALQAYELAKDDHPAGRLLSGPKTTARGFFWGAKWRSAARFDWWDHYDPAAPTVIFGHYWRQPTVIGVKKDSPWHGVEPEQWLGSGQNAFCVDYSVGRRGHQGAGANTLAAVTIHRDSGEATVTHDTGERRPLPRA